MGIKTLTGHLTAREKQIIAHMIEHGMDAARSARITVRLTRDGDVWTAHSSKMESDDWGRPKECRSRATFTVREVARV